MTARTRRIWVTAGTTGWARAPYNPDTDPALPPDSVTHLENTIMANDHTLTPADIAARCGVLGANVSVSGSNYKIIPPSDATTHDGGKPQLVHVPADADFRSKADRTLTVRNLRNNGLDVLADRDWSTADKAAETEAAVCSVEKLELPGPRPTASWSKVVTDATDEDPQSADEIIGMLVVEMRRIVEPIAEDVAKLAARLDNLETAPRPAASSGHARRLEQLDESVGSLARRVALTEGKTDTAITGLTRANDAVKALVDKVGGNAARATNLGSEIVSVRQRLDALESGAGAPAAPTESAWIDPMRQQITAVLEPFRGGAYLPRVTVAELMGMDDTDAERKRLSYVLMMMRTAGTVESAGTKSATRWRLIAEASS